MDSLQEEAIPKRGDCEKKLKNNNSNEKKKLRFSMSSNFCYNPHVFEGPQISLLEEGDWIDSPFGIVMDRFKIFFADRSLSLL